MKVSIVGFLIIFSLVFQDISVSSFVAVSLSLPFYGEFEEEVYIFPPEGSKYSSNQILSIIWH
jgi:hypothetical protein